MQEEEATVSPPRVPTLRQRRKEIRHVPQQPTDNQLNKPAAAAAPRRGWVMGGMLRHAPPATPGLRQAAEARCFESCQNPSWPPTRKSFPKQEAAAAPRTLR